MAASGSGRQPTFRQTVRERFFSEVLRAARASGGSTWKILVTDEWTVKILSSWCKISDLMEEGVQLVEDLNKRREPQPKTDAIYFIQPTAKSLQKLIGDYGEKNIYRTASVFFSSQLPPQLLGQIKAQPALMSKLVSLKELNFDFFAVDSQSFSTAQDNAFSILYAPSPNYVGPEYENLVQTAALRLATVFASLKEFPTIRYKAPKSDERNAAPARVASALLERLHVIQRSVADYPQSNSCELILVDRLIDPVAPVIHEWTYEAMVYDLLPNVGPNGMYRYTVETQGGQSQVKEALLDETDKLWVELRHSHIGEVSQKLAEKREQFNKKFNASQNGAAGGGETSMKSMAKMAAALPQYRDQLGRLYLHIDIATSINLIIRERGLNNLGQLEQDLVFGNAGSKELINFLNTRAADLPSYEKVRLLTIYAATHPDKMDTTKKVQWQKLARLSDEEMNQVTGLELLGLPLTKKPGVSIASLYPFSKRKPKAKKPGEEDWALSQYSSYLSEVIDELNGGRLSYDDFPSPNPPAGAAAASFQPAPSFGSEERTSAPLAASKSGSVRSVRSQSSWANKGAPDGGLSESSSVGNAVSVRSASKVASVLNRPTSSLGRATLGLGGSSGQAAKGQRLVIFILGGMTRGELRVAYKAAEALNREVIIGSTSLETPQSFLSKLEASAPAS